VPKSLKATSAPAPRSLGAEAQRLMEAREKGVPWRRWGPYLSEREWGTVREDYSPWGTAWEYFPHDQARSRAYRWGEDGIGGICDRHQHICFALALWNGRDPILKERLFGLTGDEGNHGEDVKEYYFYLDSTPTHSYMKFLYKYPQAEYPYTRLVEENRRRTKSDPEFELVDAGIFDQGRYFDVLVEYAKAEAEDILIRITAANRGPDPAPLWLLPTLWFRNRWSWGPEAHRPVLTTFSLPAELAGRAVAIEAQEESYGRRWLMGQGQPELLFTENETNFERLFGVGNSSPYVKDAFHQYIVHGNVAAVNPGQRGTKAAAVYRQDVPAGSSVTIRLRFSNAPASVASARPPAELLDFGADFDRLFATRVQEANEYYASLTRDSLSADAHNVIRQAFAGLLWNKQYYHYDVRTWLAGDPSQPPPPSERLSGRNHEWTTLFTNDVLSVPDNWEFPWFASWDLAFHIISLALVDPHFAKSQLILLQREWYMHPSGKLPAYEWAFSDVNPPVQAWAAWRLYRIEGRMYGKHDRTFLKRVFHKLLLNFTWWVNRKDPEGMNVFEGGFLGLDNIGVFDRSKPLPTGGHLEQSDGTAWMAMYALGMLIIAMELAREDRSYEDLCCKFFEHFVYISKAMNNRGGEGIGLWDEHDGFYYDVLYLPDGSHQSLRVRSMVGLVPLFAVQVLEPEDVAQLPDFRARMQWFLENEPEFRPCLDDSMATPHGNRLLLSLVNRERLGRLLKFALDEQEFLSPYGLRSLSKYHRDHPYLLELEGMQNRVAYEPAESRSGLFGGNSNWRGPVWMPLNYLLIEALQKFHWYFGDGLLFEFPSGSGQQLNLWEIAQALSRRISRLFLRRGDGSRPAMADLARFANDPHWRDHLLFHEYFHGDTGAGLGASHQTGWTALVAKLLEQNGE
jgi:Glycosyl hydrolase family 63 C-terminal domain